MLLQKTGSRLKQFIAHRRRNSFDESDDVIDEERSTGRKTSTNTPRRLSWLSQSPSTELATLRRASSTITTRSRPLPPVSSSASSSASSLCSCDCDPDPVSNGHSLSRPQPAPPSPEILYLPSLSSTKTVGDARAWRLIFSEPSSPSSPSGVPDRDLKDLSFANARVSTFDLLEALSMAPDEDRTPTQSARNSEEADMDISHDVSQLIRETDEAFQAVGTALEDAKAATQGWYDTPQPSQTPRVLSRPLILLKKNARSPVSLSKSPLARSVSVAKRKKPIQKRKMNVLSRALKPSPPPPANTPARWTLTDVTANVVDVFSGKMFRIEVDEMLTPGRLAKIKEENRIEVERKTSNESAQSTGTDGSTPTEPFHLESLSSRIDARLEQKPPSPDPAPPSPVSPEETESTSGKIANVRFTGTSTPPRTSKSMIIDDLTFPSPPRQTRSRSNSRAAPLLPTIPEVSPLTMMPIRVPTLSSKLPSVRLQPTESHVLLPSTPFTLTSPNFRHGAIRVERTNKTAQVMSVGPEESALDWTAFQMAISGTMDDMGTTHDADDEWEADEAEIDDIMRWWDGFGFHGFGRMVQDAPQRMRVSDGRKEEPWRNTAELSMLAELQMEFERYDEEVSPLTDDEDSGNMMESFELDTSPEDERRPQIVMYSLEYNPLGDEIVEVALQWFQGDQIAIYLCGTSQGDSKGQN
ncbi:hypothetical protein LSUE1_G002717 [Lachnellula suecica]|uniref:Uncharacterized protein n=1 Tax=Lachnellula suecica TaxID=602035 RepID=A0A8T9CGH0_9HELO|nr:hypothetical protein LSUE1_G002717 [Lachnellula suecica]